MTRWGEQKGGRSKPASGKIGMKKSITKKGEYPKRGGWGEHTVFQSDQVEPGFWGWTTPRVEVSWGDL